MKTSDASCGKHLLFALIRTVSRECRRSTELSHRSLPNWRSLKEASGAASHVLSEDDMRALNVKESNILTNNLSSSDALIPKQEIIESESANSFSKISETKR